MKLNREGVQLNAEERNKRNQNWATLEDEVSQFELATNEFGVTTNMINNEITGLKAETAAQKNGLTATNKRFDNVVIEAGTVAYEKVVDASKLIWKEPVVAFSNLATAYPQPQIGWAAQTTSDGAVYRYDGSTWKKIQQVDAGPVNALDTRLTAQLADTGEQVGSNPMSFGAIGDGVADDTQAFINANVLSLSIRLPKGKIFRLDNFVPKEGTVIFAEGATIARHSQRYYADTTSSAAIVIANKNIVISGGKHIDLSPLKETFSGSILIESGSVMIKNALIENSWGGVFGHGSQSVAKESEYVSIIDTEIRGCSHNTYLGDIKNFVFSRNHSHHSKGDGLRTYRNVRNIVITDNHIYANGQGGTQSQDAIDLFVAGHKCIIANNYLYNNVVKGIDIKKDPSNVNETVLAEKFIITGNHIFNNALGIEFTSNTELGFIENVNITDNFIYDNTLQGVRSNFADCINYSRNQIFGNGEAGLRIDNTEKGGIVSENLIYNNGVTTTANPRAGMFITDSAKNIDVIHNKLYPGGTNQQIGLSYSSNGICKDNSIKGHVTDLTIGVTVAEGVIKTKNVSSSVLSELCFIAEKPMALSSITFMTNGPGTFNIQISKRKLDGSFQAPLLYSADVVVSAGYVKQILNISALTASNRVFAEGQTCFVTITPVSGTFQNGMIQFSMLS